MLCDKYKEALIEAAAGGASLPNGLREHVEACAFCAAKLAGEQALFAAVDAGLRKAANVRVRSSFVAVVKAELATKTVPTRKPVPGWALVSATAALALGAAFVGLPRVAHNKSASEATAVPSKEPAGAGAAVSSVARERETRFSARTSKAPEEQDLSAAASHEPEVLIQPEEEESLRRFYAAARNPVNDGTSVVTENHEVAPKPLVIEQIELRDLEIENLDKESGLAQTDTR
jgi:hypothetical protein